MLTVVSHPPSPLAQVHALIASESEQRQRLQGGASGDGRGGADDDDDDDDDEAETGAAAALGASLDKDDKINKQMQKQLARQVVSPPPDPHPPCPAQPPPPAHPDSPPPRVLALSGRCASPPLVPASLRPSPFNAHRAPRSSPLSLPPRQARAKEWAAFDGQKPDDNYEAPEDVAAIKFAEARMGDFSLKVWLPPFRCFCPSM